MKIKRIIHIGVLVDEMDPVRKLYSDVLGLEVTHRENYLDVADICFLPVGDSQIELIGDFKPDGEVKKMIAEQGGPGINHIAFEVEDIEGAIKELLDRGVPMIDLVPREGAHGTRVAFLDPSATHGVSIELVQQFGDSAH
jgi:methylmalonyl-CoA/ethylmalonyl-CoA epimerase